MANKLTDFFPRQSGGIDSQKPNSELFLVGGGGGGSYEDVPGSAGGELYRGCIYLAPQCTYTVTIGAGGAGGSTLDISCKGTPDGVGSPGGTTSFGKHKAYGGAGGATNFTDPTIDCSAISIPGGLGGLGSGQPFYQPCCPCIPEIDENFNSCFNCITPSVFVESRHFRTTREGAVTGAYASTRSQSANPTGANLPSAAFYCNFCHDNIFGRRYITGISTGSGYDCTFNTICICIQSTFEYGLKIGGAPYDGEFCAAINDDAITPLQTACGDIRNATFSQANYVFGCSRSNWGCKQTLYTGPATQQCRIFARMAHIQPNEVNMGAGAAFKGGNGDSGIALVVYDCNLGAATIGPAPTNAIDCTPITGPQGYRSYVFEGPGTFTLP